jgi:hypothetical protein
LGYAAEQDIRRADQFGILSRANGAPLQRLDQYGQLKRR